MSQSTKPWEKYQEAAAGPWQKYAAESSLSVPAEAGIRPPLSLTERAKNLGRDVGDVVAGVGSGVFSTGLGVSKMVNKATGGYLGVPESTTLEDIGMQPTNNLQKAGMAAEQVGEFFVPGGAVGKGTKAVEAATAATKLPGFLKGGINVAAKAGLEAAGAGAVTAAQTGGDLEATGKAAAIAGAIPVVGAAVKPVADATKRVLSQKVPSRLIEGLIIPSKKLKAFGREPGQEVAVQGLKANTLDGLDKEVTKRLEEVGQKIDKTLSMPWNKGKRIDVATAINQPIDDAIQRAKIDGNKDLVNRLEAFRKGQFEERFKVPGNVKRLEVSPTDARKVKADMGKGFRWTEDPIEGSLNDVRQEIYRNLNTEIDGAVPGIKELNGQYGNLLNAQKATAARADAVKKLSMFGLTETALSAASMLVGAAINGDITSAGIYGLVGMAASKGVRMGSVGATTRLAAQFAKIDPAEKTKIATVIVPLLRNMGLAELSDSAQRGGRQ